MSRNMAPWIIPRTNTCGVRTLRRTVRRAMPTVVVRAPACPVGRGRLSERVGSTAIVVVVVESTGVMGRPSRSGRPAGAPGAGGGGGAVGVGVGLLFSRAAGEAQEDLVEGGAAQADVAHLQAEAVEGANGLQQPGGTVLDRNGDRAGRAIDPRRVTAERGQGGDGAVDVGRVGDVDLDDVDPGAGLEVVGCALGDDLAVV